MLEEVEEELPVVQEVEDCSFARLYGPTRRYINIPLWTDDRY